MGTTFWNCANQRHAILQLTSILDTNQGAFISSVWTSNAAVLIALFGSKDLSFEIILHNNQEEHLWQRVCTRTVTKNKFVLIYNTIMLSPRQLLNVSGQRERFFVIDRDMATSLLLSCSLILTCPQAKLLLLLPKVSVFCFFISFYCRRPPHPLCISSVWVDCDWGQVRLCRSSSSSR